MVWRLHRPYQDDHQLEPEEYNQDTIENLEETAPAKLQNKNRGSLPVASGTTLAPVEAVEAPNTGKHAYAVEGGVPKFVEFPESGQPGPKGDPGPTGARGPAGAKGDTGATGPKGDAGATGVGAPGPQGSKGDTGPQGPRGLLGASGLDGAKGDKGDTGAAGPRGATGTQGPQGATGPKGDTGPAGADSTVPGPAGPKAVSYTHLTLPTICSV